MSIKPTHFAYVVTDPKEGSDRKAIWHEVGSVRPHKSGKTRAARGLISSSPKASASAAGSSAQSPGSRPRADAFRPAGQAGGAIVPCFLGT